MTTAKMYTNIGAYNKVAKPFGQTQSIYITSDSERLTEKDIEDAEYILALVEIGASSMFVQVDKEYVKQVARVGGYGITRYYFSDNCFEKHKSRPAGEYHIILGTEIFAAIDGTSVE